MSAQDGYHSHGHSRIILAGIVVCALLATLALSCSTPLRQPVRSSSDTQLRALEANFIKIAEQALPAVVSIFCEIESPPAGLDRKQLYEWFKKYEFPMPPDLRDYDEEEAEGPEAMSMGSGWIYRSDGFIVTNAHVVRNAGAIRVGLNDREDDDRYYPAKLWGTDPKSELAVIKIEADRKLPVLELGNSQDLKVGSWVMAVGSPFALHQTVTAGIVSAKGRPLPGQSQYITIGDVIQTDASINIGNSGGPLVNLNGQVVGVNVAIASPGGRAMPVSVGIGFAIPADTAAYVVPKLIAQRKVLRGWLGVGIEDLSPNMRDFYGAPAGGALVTGLIPETPAAKSGLRVDDVITAVDEQQVASTWELQKAISRHPPPAQVKLRVVRDGEEKDLPAKLGAMPAKYTGLDEPKPSTGRKKKPGLGLEVRALDAELKREFELERDQGVVVVEVKGSSPARGKVSPGDVIVKVNRTDVQTLAEYEQAIEAAQNAGRGYLLLRLERVLAYGETTMVTADISLKP